MKTIQGSTRYTLDLPNSLYEALREEAYTKHINMSDIIREELAKRYTK